jgi:hypothetical protein
MELIEQILDTYPELKEMNYVFTSDIILYDDSDGQGAYIFKWEYDKPIPKGLKLGK